MWGPEKGAQQRPRGWGGPHDPTHFLAADLKRALESLVVEEALPNLFFDAVVSQATFHVHWQIQMRLSPMLH